jgi:hypothetical protein
LIPARAAWTGRARRHCRPDDWPDLEAFSRSARLKMKPGANVMILPLFLQKKNIQWKYWLWATSSQKLTQWSL